MIAEADAGNPSIINYSMFVAVLGMLSLFYLIPATIKDSLAISPMFVLIVDLVNVLFWFCGAVALAAKLGVHSCSNEVSHIRRGLCAVRGANDPCRTTSNATGSRMASRTTSHHDVLRRKQHARSCSSASSHSWSPLSSPA